MSEEEDGIRSLSHGLEGVSETSIQEYDNNIVQTFSKIETNGLYTKDGYEYTKYNVYTTTGRPSNSNKGINYAALNKDDGTREKYISRFENGKLIEFDYDAYHLRLIANLIGIDQPPGSFHKRKLYKKNLDNMNPQKLFNYYIQAYETEMNSKALINILNLLEDYSSKMVLYIYDAFLFDIDPNEKSLIRKIQKLMVFPSKAKVGRDYHNMRSLDL